LKTNHLATQEQIKKLTPSLSAPLFKMKEWFLQLEKLLTQFRLTNTEEVVGRLFSCILNDPRHKRKRKADFLGFLNAVVLVIKNLL
jgi:hypothetical protein